MNPERFQQAIRTLLEEIGEDPEREGLRKTPERVFRMFQELTVGYHESPEEIIGDAVFHTDYNEMVIVKDIEYYSLCEHHMLPFFGKAHVAYIPNGRIIGLSKIPRIVDMYARRLQIQEKMTVEIAETLQRFLEPQGVAVVIEGTHLCSVMRGVRKQNHVMVTSAMLGVFRTNLHTRMEFLSLIGLKGQSVG